MKGSMILAFWTPGELETEYSRTELFSDLFDQWPELICIDLKNNKDPRSLRLLGEADLAVIWIKQDPARLRSFFDQLKRPDRNVIFIIYDYFELSDWNKSSLIRRYRICEDQICILPYNARLGWLSQNGCLKQYLRSARIKDACEYGCSFSAALKDAGRKMFQALTRSSGSFI